MNLYRIRWEGCTSVIYAEDPRAVFAWMCRNFPSVPVFSVKKVGESEKRRIETAGGVCHYASRSLAIEENHEPE